jgi:hypothetical protein
VAIDRNDVAERRARLRVLLEEGRELRKRSAKARIHSEELINAAKRIADERERVEQREREGACFRFVFLGGRTARPTCGDFSGPVCPLKALFSPQRDLGVHSRDVSSSAPT